MLSEVKKQMCRKGFLKAVEMALNLQGNLFAIILHILVYSVKHRHTHLANLVITYCTVTEFF